MMKLAELEDYFSVFACASAYLHFVLPFFTLQSLHVFPPSLSLTLLPFQLFQRRGRRRTSSLPSPPPHRRPLSSPREPCRLWSRTTATTSHRACRRGKRQRRRGRPPSCSPEDSGLRYVPNVMSMFSCRIKRLTSSSAFDLSSGESDRGKTTEKIIPQGRRSVYSDTWNTCG